MNAADWLILAIVIASSLLGLFRGFLRETVALVAWIAGLWCAWTFSGVLEPYLGGMLAQPGIRVWVARMIILFVVLLIGALVGVLLQHFVRHSPFGTADRGLGTLFGFIRGVVMVGLGVLVAQLLEMNQESWWRESTLMPAGEYLADWIRSLVNDVQSE